MTRIKNIDILKFVGLFCIILAHVSPPNIIFQIRNFDVVLMIILANWLYFENQNKDNKFKSYLLKRIKRLLLPTYIFLLVFFPITFVLKISSFSPNEIIESFLLYKGIGYVWIIRIYLIVGILLPIFEKILLKYKFNKILFCNFIVFILYEFLCEIGFFKLNIILGEIVAYIVPCISIIVVTHWLMNNQDKKIILFSAINLMIFIFLAIVMHIETGHFYNTNYAKYPFRLHYLSYAFGISGILILITRNKKLIDVLYNKLITFVSGSSLWIYLWHILFVYIISDLFTNLNWIIKYIIIVFCACFVTYIQNKLVNNLERKKLNKEVLKIFKG